MKWSTVFEQVAARPESLAEIARLNGTTPDEILTQIKLQVTCAGANQEAARRARDALSRRATADAESEERKKLQEEIRKQLEDKAKEKAEEMAKEAWEKQQEQARQQAQQQAQQQERARQLQEQARRQQQAQQQAQQAQQQAQQQERLRQMREQAQRQQQAQQKAQQKAEVRRGCSRYLKSALYGIALTVGLIILGIIAKQAFPDIFGGNDTIPQPTAGPTVAPTCAPLVSERRKCPWSPDNYAVEPCPPGFCYDAGPQGSLSCKQEVAPENSFRDYYSSVQCNEGYTAVRDPCTGVILQCVQ